MIRIFRHGALPDNRSQWSEFRQLTMHARIRMNLRQVVIGGKL